MEELYVDFFNSFLFKKEFKNFFKDKLHPLRGIKLTNKEIEEFRDYLSNHEQYKDIWHIIENKIRTLYYYYKNKNIKKKELRKIIYKQLKEIIYKTLRDKAKEIDALHRVFTEEAVKDGQDSYFMITTFPKRQFNIIDGVYQVIDARKEITSILKEYTRYRNITNRYIHITEISKNNKVHLHSYYYFQLDDEELKKLKERIEKKLGSSYDVHIQKMDINYKFAKNYSSFENNLMKKMGQMPKNSIIMYFILMKLFGKNRFITHTKVLSFKRLRRCMAFLHKKGIIISYSYLIKSILNKTTKIKVYVTNTRVTLAILYLLSRDINLLFPPSNKK